MFEFLRIFGCIVIGACLGWGASAHYHGLSVNPFDAATSTQRAIDTAVTATQGIDASARSTAAAKERVRVVIERIEVDKECPPGRGAVSPDVARRMRAAFAVERPGAGDVYTSSNGGVPDSRD